MKQYSFDDVVILHDKDRIPLSAMERQKRQGPYRYYGAQGVIDHVDNFLFDGEYVLIAEDGENLKSQKQYVAQLVHGKFWVNNHAHIATTTSLCRLRYFYYLINSKDLSEYITGSVQPKLSQASMRKMSFVLPNINTQDKILEILGGIDDKIEENERINKNLQAQADTIFSKAYNASTDQQPFTSVIKVLGGGTPKTGNSDYWNGSIPFFTPKDVGDPYTFRTEKYITESGLEHCNSRLYPINTSFVTARGTVGKVSLAGAPMAMNQSCYALVSDVVDPLMVYFYALKAVTSLKHKASGAVFDAIVTRDFDTEVIHMLSDSDSQRVIEAITPMMKTIHNNATENIRLSELRDALLPRLMSGEIDVSDIDL